MTETPTPEQLRVASLGEPRFDSPRSEGYGFEEGDRTILVANERARLERQIAAFGEPTTFEAAGPRRKLFFDPSGVTAGIVTCGGLCPGLNDVIRSIVLALHYGYGVRRVLGFRYGYAGLTPEGEPPLDLTLERVHSIHQSGGTILGSSRGAQSLETMIETLVARGVDMLFTIGGDGTLRGAHALAEEIAVRGLPIAVVAIPKTIDNDLPWTRRSFGFATAVGAARNAIASAHVEALGAYNGVGLVKLMGRHAGFITAHATLSSGDVNFCLVPETPFTLHGKGGFLEALEARLADKHHAVIAVAEGAGQALIGADGPAGTDASGNVRLRDIGTFLQAEIVAHFRARGTPLSLKYMDPSYLIRSLATNALDAEYCLRLGQHAVHAGMSGRTSVMIGFWNQNFTHAPLELVCASRRFLDPAGRTWTRVLESTGQPASMAAPA